MPINFVGKREREIEREHTDKSNILILPYRCVICTFVCIDKVFRRNQALGQGQISRRAHDFNNSGT